MEQVIFNGFDQPLLLVSFEFKFNLIVELRKYTLMTFKFYLINSKSYYFTYKSILKLKGDISHCCGVIDKKWGKLIAYLTINQKTGD